MPGSAPGAFRVVRAGALETAPESIYCDTLGGSVSIWTMSANGTHTTVNLGVVATAWTIVE